MGIIIAKFRKKKTTFEVLEKLENEIQSIEAFRRSTEQTQKKMVGRFIIISICVYCLTALILYFYFFPATAYERIIYIIPLIILPILLILIKRILSWYYNRKIRKNQQKLTNLKDEKKKILEEVMDKETYKVAKTILEKFAPEQIKKNPFSNNENTPIKSGSLTSFNSGVQIQTGVRYRGQFSTSTAPQLMSGASATPRLQRSLLPSTPSLLPKQPQSVVPSTGPPTFSGTPLLLPRAILPRDRSVLDKMVEYLIGDGPSNRYALICKNCSSHNGMALREEFDYLSFRCCYCSTFNPARKQRPVAPKLESSLSIKDRWPNASDSEKHSGSESESESESSEPIVTEPPESKDNIVSHVKTSLSDSEKLSDYEIKSSDTESSAMDVDAIPESKDISSQESDAKLGNTPEETKKQD